MSERKIEVATATGRLREGVDEEGKGGGIYLRREVQRKQESEGIEMREGARFMSEGSGKLRKTGVESLATKRRGKEVGKRKREKETRRDERWVFEKTTAVEEAEIFPEVRE